MTDEQKEIIVTMQHSEDCYRKIAIKLELSRDAVRNYCKAKHLCGSVDGQKIMSRAGETVCVRCGKIITNGATGRKRKYCSMKCKQK